MINTKLTIALATSATILGGCSNGQDNFSTEPGKGFGWKSMSETNQIIQNGGDIASTSPQPYVISTDAFSGIQRVPEQYLRVWVPPYQDSTGNLHEETAIQVVFKGGEWRLPNPRVEYAGV